MRLQSLVTATLFTIVATEAEAQQPNDSAAWIAGITEADSAMPVRWRVNTVQTSNTPVLLGFERSDASDIAALSGQVDIYPFGDEFYLSAGTVTQRGDRSIPAWMRQADGPAWAAFPHAELSEELNHSNIDALTRYFGAGITVRTMDAWSITMEGGAYFRDTSEDRLVLFDPDTGTQATLLDDMDDLAGDAVGETQSRSVRPVGHLVLRRRF